MAKLTIVTKTRTEVYIDLSNKKAEELFEKISFYLENSTLFFLTNDEDEKKTMRVFQVNEVTDVVLERD